LAGGADAIASLFGVELQAAKPTNGRTPGTPLAIGTEAPVFSALTTDGTTLHSSELRGSETALVFWSPSCGFCRQAADDLVRWERTDRRRLVLLSSAPDDDLTTRGFQGPVAIDDGMRIGAAFGAAGTPMAVLIAADGAVVSDLAAGRDAIETLFQRSVGPVAR
jgi:thiol-disulfide isomerase/thioredoxin